MAESWSPLRHNEPMAHHHQTKDSYNISEASDGPFSTAPKDDIHGHGYGNTRTDSKDMMRLGKKQEFKRNFNLWSSIGFVAIYMATWEFILITLSIGFTNGGYAAMFWCFVTTTLSYSAVVASLAEMSSMAPTSGGQYHWVSEFAPPEYQKVLSYASGWMTTLGWVTGFASSCYTVRNPW